MLSDGTGFEPVTMDFMMRAIHTQLSQAPQWLVALIAAQRVSFRYPQPHIHSNGVFLIALALCGKSVVIVKVIKMIDDMVALLK